MNYEDHDLTDADQLSEAHGTPAEGALDTGAREPLGRPGMKHWKQSTISDPNLDGRDGVFFAAVEMTRMPMILADPNQADCPIVFANNAFLDLTGYEESEVLGRNCRFLQGANTSPTTVAVLRDAVRDHKPVAVELLNYRRDGKPFWNAIFIAPVFDPQGEILYFFASQLDVSQRRETESALRQSQKMEAIGQLTAGLGHDFNNLLQIVGTSLDRMRANRDNDAAFERHYSAATSAVERGAKLTKQLLTFARRTRLEPKPLDLSAQINSFGELLESSIGERAKLYFNVQRRLPSVKLDPHHLEMALLNIVVNARDASPAGGPITVTTRQIHLNGDAAARHLEPGDYVMLSVTDEGTGMEPHIQARAMEPFFTTKRLGEGTGLGLAMVHGFVEQSGGRLEIRSKPGAGTTVEMLFPVSRNEPELLKSAFRPEKVPQEAQAAPRILVVDDSKEIAANAAEALEELEYRVSVAFDGEAALATFTAAMADGDPFALVFSDVSMPGGMNGVLLATRVKEVSPGTAVLLTTGYNDEMSQDSTGTSSMDVLGKPYKPAEMISRVQSALKRHRLDVPLRKTSDFGHAQA